jgi:hypothetical protein
MKASNTRSPNLHIQGGDQHLVALQALFNIQLPTSVRRWLVEGAPIVAGGLPLLGLPIGPDLDNAWGATQYLQALRPDLDPNFLVIRLVDDRVLCIDLGGSLDGKSPLVEIDCNTKGRPKDLNKSFEAFLQDAAFNDSLSHRIFDRVDELLQKYGYSYDHMSGGKLPRAHQWRIVRSCVHDRLVGLAALRQNDQSDTTEIDLFEVADHPLYEPGHGVRSLLALVFADAYKAGSSMRLNFRAVPGIRTATIPEEIVAFAQTSGVTLTRSRSGSIDHLEGSALFAAAVGLSAKTISSVQSKRMLALDSISYLAASRIWSLEEMDWLLDQCARPDVVLFGLNDAKDWLAYAEALTWGRAATLTSAFRAALNEDGEEGVEATSVEAVGSCFRFRVVRPTIGPWSTVGLLKPGDTIALLPRPRLPLAFESSLIIADAKKLVGQLPDATFRLIAQSQEAPGIHTQAVQKQLDEMGVRLAVSPYSIADLDILVEAKFARASRIRR